MYPITSAIKALFDAEQRQVLRITGMAPMKSKTISIYSGDTKIFESGADQSIAVYSGDTEIYSSSDSTEIDVYSGDKLIYYYDNDGLYSLTITDADVLFDGFSIDRYCCNGEKLEVGTAIAGQMTLKLNNTDGRFDNVIFEGMEMFVEIGIADWTQSEPTITYIPCGYFTPDMQPRRLNHIDLTCLDRMTRFDVVVEPTDLTLPATVAGLVGQINTLCGVTLAESIDTLPNADVVITELPTVTGDMTYRNLIQWCAGIMATNAWFDWNGQLRFTWYDQATGYETTTANQFDSDYYEEDLTITGAVYTNSSGVEIVEGTDDYAIDLTGNSLAGPLIATVLPVVNTAINGFAYRPLTAVVVNAPYLWPMDTIDFTDKDGNTYSSVLTNVAFGLNGTTALESKGLTYAINQRAQPKGVTKEQAQIIDEVAQSVEDLDESLTQQEIFNRLTDNGAAQGIFMTQDGQLYVNASYLKGGVIDGNEVTAKQLKIVDANGNIIASFDSTIVLGKSSDARAELDFNSFEILDNNGDTLFYAGDLRDINGQATVTVYFEGDGTKTRFTVPLSDIISMTSLTVDGVETTAYTIESDYIIVFNSAPADGAQIVATYITNHKVIYYDLGSRIGPVGYYSVAEGRNTTASGDSSHAEGKDTIARGNASHAEGDGTLASAMYAHAEGYDTVASGASSHAEGNSTQAIASQSHAEGYNTVAEGAFSHAEGNDSVANGESAHAEGYDTKTERRAAHAEGISTYANGAGSHAQGVGTIASGNYQHAAGKYNIEDTSSVGIYAEIIGNGSSDNNRSNARTLDWNGNEWIAGALSVGDAATTRANLGITPANIGFSELALTNQTIDANGNINTGLNAGNVVVSARCSGFICTPWVSGSTGTWWVHLTYYTGGAVPSGTNVGTVRLYYYTN